MWQNQSAIFLRSTVLQTMHLCFSCLDDYHSYKDCTAPAMCKTCDKSHPTALHKLRTNQRKNYQIIWVQLQQKILRNLASSQKNQWLNKLVATDTFATVTNKPNINKTMLSWILPVWVSTRNNPAIHTLVYTLVDSV